MLKSILSRILLQGCPTSKLVLKTIKIITSSQLFVSIKASFEDDKKIINKLSKCLSSVKINTNIITISLKSIALSPCRDCIYPPSPTLSPPPPKKKKLYKLKSHKLSEPMV